MFWADQGVQPLPEEIVKRFDGKVIAIQGYEQDQVKAGTGGNCLGRVLVKGWDAIT